MKRPTFRHTFPQELRRRTLAEAADVGAQKRAEDMVAKMRVVPELRKKICTSEDGLEVIEGVTVLSIGAGLAHELDELDQQLPKSKMLAVDPHEYMNPSMEKRAKTLAHNFEYLPETAQATNLEGVDDSSVDCVIIANVLHHIPADQHEAVMKEIRRVLKPDGIVGVSEDIVNNDSEYKRTVAADRLWNQELREKPHYYRSEEDWRDFFAESGFQVEHYQQEIGLMQVRYGSFRLRKVEK